jgi:hypothetical protein
MTERELLIDCLGRLNGLGVAYMVTGSMASNYWGIPRTTHDLDFVVQLPPSAVEVAVQQGDLDLNYLRHWAVELGVQDALQQILDGKLKPKTT